MTAAPHARRLLARLVDESALETEPIAEVRADLAALGVDPAASVALARRMVAGGPSPALVLLGRIATAESVDDDVRRLEQADIADIRRQVPSGESAAAVARVHRTTGRGSNVVGLRRRRSRRLLYGLSGMAAALAASVVFYIGVSEYQGQQLRLAPPAEESDVSNMQAPAPSPPAPAIETRPAPETLQKFEAAPPAQDSAGIQARMEPAADAPAAAQPAAEAPAAPAGSGAATETRTDAEVAPALAPLALPDEGVAAKRREVERLVVGGESASQRDELTGDAKTNVIASPFGIKLPILELLIVDSSLAPVGLRQNQYAIGQLRARLDDARRLAAGRPIAALAKLQLPEGSADAVILAQLALQESEGDRGLAVAMEKTASEPAIAGYEVLLLDRR